MKYLNTKTTRLLGLGSILLIVSFAASAEERQTHSTFSGWNVPVDPDAGGTGASHGEFAGNGTFGRFEAGVLTEVEEWDMVSFCGPTNVVLVVSQQTVARYNDGSLLNRSASGTICFNFVDNSSTIETAGEITGGFGRFEGASGFNTCTSVVQDVAAEPGMVSFMGECSGVTILP